MIAYTAILAASLTINILLYQRAKKQRQMSVALTAALIKLGYSLSIKDGELKCEYTNYKDGHKSASSDN